MEEQLGGTWSAIRDLTVHGDVYNWPQYPSIDVGNDGVVHVFWYQEFHDDCQTFSGETVFYKTREEGTWVDRSFTLNGHVGRYTRLCLDRFSVANFAWSEVIADAEEVFCAGYIPSATVADRNDGVPIRVIAQPNPFDASTTIRIESDDAVGLDLAVFDASGRLVRKLAEGEAGVRLIAWDGRDAAGRPLPVGAYRVRLLARGQSTSINLIRLR